MRLVEFTVANFRAIREVHLEPKNRLVVLVGPNGIGKTSVFDALRLLKVVWGQYYAAEPAETLADMLFASPSTSEVFYDAIVRHGADEARVEATFTLGKAEIDVLRAEPDRVVLSEVRRRLGRPEAIGASGLLDTDLGKKVHAEVRAQVHAGMTALKTTQKLSLGLSVHRGRREIRPVATAGDPFGSAALAYLFSQYARPAVGHVNFFSANRALDPGQNEVSIGDAALLSELRGIVAVPGLKFSGLKQALLGALFQEGLPGESGTAPRLPEEALKHIFETFVPRKRYAGLRRARGGRLLMEVTSADGGAHDVDYLSSGEKEVLMVFANLNRFADEGTIFLVDEPELHLSPRLQRKVPGYLLRQIEANGASQVLLSTHSEEILHAAYASRETDLWAIGEAPGPQARRVDRHGDAAWIHAELGVTPEERLLGYHLLYVDGWSDDSVLRLLLPGGADAFRVKAYGARRDLSKPISRLQKEEEKRGGLDNVYFFLLDRDRSLAGVTPSKHVRFARWGRACLESYFLDPEVVWQAARDSGCTKFGTAYGVKRELLRYSEDHRREAAGKAALRALAVPDVSPGTRAPRDVEGLRDELLRRAESARKWIAGFDGRDGMRRAFNLQYELAMNETKGADWLTYADGRRVIASFHKEHVKAVPLPMFRERVAEVLAEKGAADLSAMRAVVVPFLSYRP